MGDSLQEANAELSSIGLPQFDKTAFRPARSTRLSAVAATVIVCAGRISGSALIIPPGASLADCVRVPLPNYSNRMLRFMVLDSREGWISALLSWRNSGVAKEFDHSIRRVSVMLWECVVGRSTKNWSVSVAMGKLTGL